MGLQDVVSFEIKSTLELPSDEFTARMASTATFRGAAPGEAVKLKIGLDGKTVTVLDGAIDRYTLVVEEDRIVSAANGRDNASRVLDHQFKKLYTNAKPDADLGFDFIVGKFKASFIAKEAVESTGMSLSWECPDYELKENFTASGRIIDTVRRLIAPWVVTERFKTDIFVRGTVVFVRQRAEAPTAEKSFTLKELRGTLTTQKERLPLVGKVTILGELHDPGGDAPFGGLTIGRVGTRTRTKTARTFNPNGSLKSVEVKEQTVRIPEETVIAEKNEESIPGGFGLRRVKKQFISMEFTQGIYNSLGQRVNPMIKTHERWITFSLPEDKSGQQDLGETLKLTQQKEIDFEYDDDGLETLRDETVLEPDDSGNLVPITRVVQRKDDTSPGVVKEITDVYEVVVTEKKDAQGVVIGTEMGELFLRSTVVQENPGQRPGFLLSAPTISTQQVERRGIPRKLESVVSNDPKAVDVSLNFPHLNEAQMQKVLDQLAQQSGVWRTTIRIRQAAHPLIRKGMILQITGINDADGNDIPLQAALVVEQTFIYDEASDRPSSLSTLTLVYWSANP